jgi:uncharacterized membrane protein YfcA
MVVPLMVITVGDAKQSVGWLLPIMCTADVFALFFWRKYAAVNRLFSLAPWVAAGMALGAVALSLSEQVLRTLVGVIVLAMLMVYLWRRFRPGTATVAPHPVAYGVSAGFATTVANAAGPVMNLYLLSKRLPKEEFIATGAWFFFFINLTKVVIYLGHGMITQRSLAFDAVLVPAVLCGALTGRWVAGHIDPRVFEIVVILLTAVSTLLLFQ